MSKREMGSAANANASASASAPKEHEQEHEHDQGEKQEHEQGEKQEQKHEADEPGLTEWKKPEQGGGCELIPGDANIHRDGAGTGGRERVQDVLVPWVLKSNSTSSKRKPKSSSSSKPTAQSKPTINGTQTSQGTATNTDAGEEPEGEKGEEEKVYHRYYHLFVQGELRELIHEAGEEDGYRIIPSTPPPSSSASESLSNSDIPLSSLSISPSTTSSTPTMTKTTSLGNELGRDDKWLRIKGEGWEADNWWVEAEVGIGRIVD